jgi:uncharacterized secreted repeat protein (TIGR03808 family)
MTVSRRHILAGGALGLGAAALVPARGAAAPFGGAVIDAATFGVTPDGVSDQSAALQRAIDAAIGARATLALPGGPLRASGLVIAAPVHVAGVPGLTTLLAMRGGPVITIRDTSHVFLSDLAVDGGTLAPGADGGLVEAVAVRDLRIARCRVQASTGSGVVLRACSGAVTETEIAFAANAGLFSTEAQGLEISGCHVHDCGNNGILVWQSAKQSDGTIVANNRIERIAANDGGSGQNGNGVNIYRAGNVIVAANRIADCAFSAVRSNAGSACQITANNCSRLGEVALYAEFGFEGAVISGNIVEQAAAGIAITNFNEGGRMGVCAGNIVRDLFMRPGEEDERGIGIGVEADTTVSGNVVENAPMAGIMLGWSHYLRDVSATGNVVRNSGIGIGASVTPGAGAALVANNLVSGWTKAAIAGMDRFEVVVADLTKAAPGRAGNVTVSGNSVG